jgi:hypothetical protein
MAAVAASPQSHTQNPELLRVFGERDSLGWSLTDAPSNALTIPTTDFNL